MKKITKFDLLLYILIILFGLVLFTSCLTSKLYARYISSADGGDFARVAVWKVNATGDDDNLRIDLFNATTVEDVFYDVLILLRNAKLERLTIASFSKRALLYIIM